MTTTSQPPAAGAVVAPVTVPGPVRQADDGRRPRWQRVLFVLALVAAAVVFLLPFVWLVGASLRPREYVFAPGLLPTPFAPDNYARAWDAMPLFTWLFNSVVVGVAAAAAATLSSAWVAFGFAYFRFPGRNVLFGLVLATMMLPFAVTMIPTYLIWNRLGLVDTQVPLWAGNLFGSAFYIFLLRQFFLSLPREYFEAARVDGASYPQLFWRMAFPLVRPALLVAFVFEFKASWTDLVKPLIYLRNEQLYTLPRGLKVILDRFGYGGEQQWEVVLAASVIATVPMIVLFFLAQRHFVEGIATGGRKG
ncbi:MULTISPECIES: carbohydrate ABC transporter permease [unclassified Micromonospora]|uniref:carbohydrate ABC transporter permease n=1 Tax=unclassified Micromonospora TaxID=2617518 RepID=UPI00188DE6EA|nr:MULTISPECIES: carbohydrate ABC transporter permease [unclassified Micromonospora]MBF5029218.1 carbohydrate ABC transporter permease [Micromonospora sp. ANENR4]MCZ7475651.1 carbohydrate ABC transporter permease [Micromonospora sp. WMMC273]WBC06258.1 carbohydrate ABC transporter permease [Micromonospora sp. WMMA1976]